MIISYENGSLLVEKSVYDRKMNESTLLYHVKLALNEVGFNMVKQLMWKDDHMVSDTQHYLKPKKGNGFYVYNNSYAIYDAGHYLNEYGEVVLAIEHNILGKDDYADKLQGLWIVWQSKDKEVYASLTPNI